MYFSTWEYLAWLGALCEAMRCTWGQSWAVPPSPVDFWILTPCWHQCPNSQLLPSARLLSSLAHAVWEGGMMVQMSTSCPSWVSELIILLRDSGPFPIPRIFYVQAWRDWQPFHHVSSLLLCLLFYLYFSSKSIYFHEFQAFVYFIPT